jgi:hypothetical protein
MKLTFIGDLFNLTNSRKVRLIDQNFETTAGQLNGDFTHPNSFRLPFNFRAGVRLEF